MSKKQFHLRTDVQGRILNDRQSLSADQVEDVLLSEIRDWLAAPRLLLQLTCGDTRLAVMQGTAPPEKAQAADSAGAADGGVEDLVNAESAESFPASDPPSWSGTSIDPRGRERS